MNFINVNPVQVGNTPTSNANFIGVVYSNVLKSSLSYYLPLVGGVLSSNLSIGNSTNNSNTLNVHSFINVASNITVCSNVITSNINSINQNNSGLITTSSLISGDTTLTNTITQTNKRLITLKGLISIESNISFNLNLDTLSPPIANASLMGGSGSRIIFKNAKNISAYPDAIGLDTDTLWMSSSNISIFINGENKVNINSNGVLTTSNQINQINQNVNNFFMGKVGIATSVSSEYNLNVNGSINASSITINGSSISGSISDVITNNSNFTSGTGFNTSNYARNISNVLKANIDTNLANNSNFTSGTGFNTSNYATNISNILKANIDTNLANNSNFTSGTGFNTSNYATNISNILKANIDTNLANNSNFTSGTGFNTSNYATNISNILKANIDTNNTTTNTSIGNTSNYATNISNILKANIDTNNTTTNTSIGNTSNYATNISNVLKANIDTNLANNSNFTSGTGFNTSNYATNISNVLNNSINTNISNLYSTDIIVYTPVRQYPSKLYNSITNETTTTFLNKTVYTRDLTLDTTGISYGSGVYTMYISTTYDLSSAASQLIFDYNTDVNTSGMHFKSSTYNATTGLYNGTNGIVSGYNGEWVILKLPNPIIFNKLEIISRNGYIPRAPAEWKCYGSNDNGNTFTEITTASQMSRLTTGDYVNNTYTKSFNNSISYLYIGFTFNKLVGDGLTLNFIELKIFGQERIQPYYISSNILTTYLNNYLPKSGGTMTGQLQLSTTFGNNSLLIYSSVTNAINNIELKNNLSKSCYIGIGAGGYNGNYMDTLFIQSPTALILNTGGNGTATTPNFIINSSGNVGIGTTNPTCKLSLGSSSGYKVLSLWDNGETNNFKFNGFGANLGLCFNVFTTSDSFQFRAGVNSTSANELMRISGTGFVGINTTDPKCHLQVNGIGSINNGSENAVTNGKMQSGSLTIGGINADYGTAIDWSGNTAGLMMECLNYTEIVIHDAGNRLASFMYYDGPNNTFNIGRLKGDTAWGVANTKIHGVLTTSSNIDCGGGIAINGANAFYSGTGIGAGVNAVDTNNATNTYINFKPAGTENDWCYVRQIGGANNYKLAFDFHDNDEARFCIRSVKSANSSTTDNANEVFLVDNGNVTATGTINASINLQEAGTNLTSKYLQLSGGTMTGQLIFTTTTGNNPIRIYSTSSTVNNCIQFENDTAKIVYLGLGGSGISGTNYKNNFFIQSTNGIILNVNRVSESTPNFIINNSGNVGIGTTNPNNILQVGDGGKLRIANGITDYSLLGSKDVDDYTNTRIVVSANGRGSGYAGCIEYVSTSNGDHIFYATSNIRNDIKMIIKNSGNVGIGVTNPSCRLQLKTEAVVKQICLYEGSINNYNFVGFGNGGGMILQLNSIAFDSFIFNVANAESDATGNNELMRIKGNGNVGIGTNNPLSKLHINHTSTSFNAEYGGLYVFNPNNIAGNVSVLGARIGGTLASKAGISLDVSGGYGWSIYIKGSDTTDRYLRFNKTWAAIDDTATEKIDFLKIHGITGDTYMTGICTAKGFNIDSNTINNWLFNNSGFNHATISDFNNITGFGYRFINGNGSAPLNGPATGDTQYYSWHIGLGAEYPAITGNGSYGMQFAIGRNDTNPKLCIRRRQNTYWTSWEGLTAEKAVSLTSGHKTISGNLTVDGILTLLKNNWIISSDNVARIYFQDNSTTYFHSGSTGTPFIFRNFDQGDIFSIDNSGNVSSAGSLSITGTITNGANSYINAGGLRLGGWDGITLYNYARDIGIYCDNGRNINIGFWGGNTILSMNNSGLTITGNVGIGITNPNLNLQVGSTNANHNIGRAILTAGHIHNADKRDFLSIGRWDGSTTADWEFTGLKYGVITGADSGETNDNHSCITFHTWGNSIYASREVARINSRGVFSALGLVVSGNVGIGITNPFAPLCIGSPTTNNSDGNLVISKNINNNGYRNFKMGYDGYFNFCFGDFGAALSGNTWRSTDLTINYNTGNIGIGVVPHATYKLDVNGSLNASTINRAGVEIDSRYLKLSGGTMTGQLILTTTTGDNPIRIYSTSTTVNNCIQFQNDNSKLAYIGLGGSAIPGANYKNNFFIQSTNGIILNVDRGSDSTPNFIINSSGNVGIGTTNPIAKLHIFEATGTTATGNTGSIILDHDNSGGASSITFRSKFNKGSDYGYIQYQDDSTIGGTSECSKLIIGTQNDVSGNISDDILLLPSGGVAINTTTTSGYILYVNGTTYLNGDVTATKFIGPLQGKADTAGTADSANIAIALYSLNNYTVNNITLRGNIKCNDGVKLGFNYLDFTNDSTLYTSGRINLGSGDWHTYSYNNIYASTYKPGIATNIDYNRIQYDSYPATLISGHFFTGGGIGINADPNTSYSIVTNKGCWFNGSSVYTSDIRIKTNIIDINDDSALQKILNIQPKTYEYIDKKNKGSNIVYGFIAQQIKEIIPEAIELNTGYIPNIYLEGTYNSNIVYLNDITNLNINDNIQINLDYQIKYLQIKNINITEKYIELNENIKTFNNTSNCFVYGTKINDFHTLNKDYIFTLNVCATQELHRLIQGLQTVITNQNTIIQAQQNEINLIKSHLNL